MILLIGLIEMNLPDKSKCCVFMDLCKFYRGFNRDCHNREQARERCGQAREKLKEIEALK